MRLDRFHSAYRGSSEIGDVVREREMGSGVASSSWALVQRCLMGPGFVTVIISKL